MCEVKEGDDCEVMCLHCQCQMASGWGGSTIHLHCLDVATLDNVDLQGYGGRHPRLLLFSNNVQNESKLSCLLDLRACGQTIDIYEGWGAQLYKATIPNVTAMTCSAPTRNVYFQLTNMHWKSAAHTGSHHTRTTTVATLDLDRLPFKQPITSGIAAQQTKRQRSPGRLGVLIAFLELHNSS